MYCYVMQPWVTIRGQSTVTTINQSADCWLDLSAFQDIVAWLDCKEVSVSGSGASVQIAYQTSPTKDDSLFVPIVSAFTVTAGVSTTIMLKDGSVTTPLCRWLRWQLTVTPTPTSAWDATFRIFIAANIVGRGGRAKASTALRATRAPSASGPAGVASSVPSTPLHLQGSSFSYGTAVPVPATYAQRSPPLQPSMATITGTPSGKPSILG
jgi:hypothetical protein